MRKAISAAAALGLILLLSSSFSAAQETVTLEGELLCARCTLKEDFAQCQTALVVEAAGERDVYYIVKNEVADQAGHPCTGKWDVKVTGSVAQKDGQSWLTASSIERLDG